MSLFRDKKVLAVILLVVVLLGAGLAYWFSRPIASLAYEDDSWELTGFLATTNPMPMFQTDEGFVALQLNFNCLTNVDLTAHAASLYLTDSQGNRYEAFGISSGYDSTSLLIYREIGFIVPVTEKQFELHFYEQPSIVLNLP